MSHELATRPQLPQMTFSELERMAQAVAKSGLFGMKTADQALALFMVCQAEGIHPALAARDYNIIDGRPAIKTDAMLSRYISAGGRVEWLELTDAKVEAIFTPPPGCGKPLTLAWTIEQATKAGLNGKQNWQRYPRAMLRSRVVSEGIRSTFPGVVVGQYTIDEVRDGVEEIDVTPPRDPPPAKAADEVIDVETGEIKSSDAAPPRLSDSALADHLSAIDAASTLAEVKKAYAQSYAAALALKDGESLQQLSDAKEKAKARLTPKVDAA